MSAAGLLIRIETVHAAYRGGLTKRFGDKAAVDSISSNT